MKIKTILEAAIHEDLIPQSGFYENNGTCTLRDYFGAVGYSGAELQKGTYYYLYAQDYSDVFSKIEAPDIRIETEEAGPIWLWKIDD